MTPRLHTLLLICLPPIALACSQPHNECPDIRGSSSSGWAYLLRATAPDDTIREHLHGLDTSPHAVAKCLGLQIRSGFDVRPPVSRCDTGSDAVTWSLGALRSQLTRLCSLGTALCGDAGSHVVDSARTDSAAANGAPAISVVGTMDGGLPFQLDASAPNRLLHILGTNFGSPDCWHARASLEPLDGGPSIPLVIESHRPAEIRAIPPDVVPGDYELRVAFDPKRFRDRSAWICRSSRGPGEALAALRITSSPTVRLRYHARMKCSGEQDISIHAGNIRRCDLSPDRDLLLQPVYLRTFQKVRDALDGGTFLDAQFIQAPRGPRCRYVVDGVAHSMRIWCPPVEVYAYQASDPDNKPADRGRIPTQEKQCIEGLLRVQVRQQTEPNLVTMLEPPLTPAGERRDISHALKACSDIERAVRREDPSEPARKTSEYAGVRHEGGDQAAEKENAPFRRHWSIDGVSVDVEGCSTIPTSDGPSRPLSNDLPVAVKVGTVTLAKVALVADYRSNRAEIITTGMDNVTGCYDVCRLLTDTKMTLE